MNYNPYYQMYNMQPNMMGQPAYRQPVALQGKPVDSIDVVKSMDIPIDGSISYYPVADGSAIVTKQLQQDGTSRILVYKPVQDTPPVQYATTQELEEIKQKLEALAIKVGGDV